MLLATKDNRTRVGRLLQNTSNHRTTIPTVFSGDIAAAIGLLLTTTGDSYTDVNHHYILTYLDVPDPVIQVSLEPHSKTHQDKLDIGLQLLSTTHPLFKAQTNPTTGTTLIAGLGTYTLDILVHRLLRTFKVAAKVGTPQVAYRQTFTKTASAQGKFVRQSGGKGQYGHVWIEFTPNTTGKGFTFTNALVGGVVPRTYIPAVTQGLLTALANGVLAGYHLIHVLAKL